MKKFLIISLAMAFILGSWGVASAALVFNLDFGQDGAYETNWVLAPSEMVWIDIYVSNVPDPGLLSMGFDFIYDPTQLEVTAGTDIDMVNWFLGPGVTPGTPAGEIEMKGGRLGTGLSGDDILLGTIELHCLGAGTSELWLFDSDRQGTYADFVLVDETVLDGDLADGIMVGTIVNTPIPGAVWLLGTGLVGLIGLRRRRN